MQVSERLFSKKMIYSFSKSFQKLSNDEMKADKNDIILAYVRKKTDYFQILCIFTSKLCGWMLHIPLYDFVQLATSIP